MSQEGASAGTAATAAAAVVAAASPSMSSPKSSSGPPTVMSPLTPLSIVSTSSASAPMRLPAKSSSPLDAGRGPAFPTTPALPSAVTAAAAATKRPLEGNAPQQPSRTQPTPIVRSGTPTTLTPSSSTTSIGGRPPLAERLAPKFVDILITQGPGEADLLPDDDIKAVAREIAEAIAALGSEATEKFKVLHAGLKDPLNYALRASLRDREMDVSKFVVMRENDMMNPEMREKHRVEMAERLKQRNVQALLAANAGPGTDLFKCPQCGKRNCSMNQKQTRSGDEPMTIFLTCNECYRVFRRQ